jgi:serine/threonine-protein kinase HipA
MPPPISRDELLRRPYSPALFDELVRAYLSTGVGVAGLQPKILVPDRPTIPVPTLIVKAGSPAYPGLAANEFLCLSAARRAGIEVPGFELSDDGQLLVLDRFDITASGERLGFEDVAALMGLRVRDVLSDRKYQGSYERVVELLRYLRLPQPSLARFFEQLAFSVMVRNGDAHLKNFGVLYRSPTDAWLAPMFDVVTTSIYPYARYPGGPELEDRTLALKFMGGRHGSRAYPSAEELLHFGRRLCGVSRPAEVLQRIAQGLTETLQAARSDPRVPPGLLAPLQAAWEEGLGYAREA